MESVEAQRPEATEAPPIAPGTAPRRFDVRDYLRLVQKRKWLMIVVFAAAVTVGGMFARVQQPAFEAVATVSIRRVPQGLLFISGENPRLPDSLSLETHAAKARSVSVADAALERLHQEDYKGTIPAEAADLQKTLRTNASEPDLIIIRSTTGARGDAVAYANAAAQAFVDASTSTRKDEIEAAMAAMQKQLEEGEDGEPSVEEQLAAAERAVAKFQEENGIFSPTEDLTRVLEARAAYQRLQADARASAGEASAAAAALAGQLQNTPQVESLTAPVESPVVTQLRLELARKRAELAEARARYTPEYGKLQDLEAEVEELEAELRLRQDETVEQTTYTRSASHDRLLGQLADAEARAAGWRQRERTLGQVLRDHGEAIEDLPAKSRQLAALIAEAERLRTLRDGLRAQLQESKINSTMETPQAAVLSEATAATQIAPQTQKTIFFAAILGAFLAFGLALTLELLDVTIRTSADLTGDCALPFLGMIPWIEDATPQLVTATAPKSPPAEAYRTLRSNVNFSLVDQPCKSFLITSAGAGEGKSMVVANLATVMAQTGQRVLLVDTDLRRPALHTLVGGESTPGLTNVLVGDFELGDAIRDSDVPGLSLLPSGPLPPNPAELLDSQKMTDLVKTLEERYDAVLFDSPPAIVLTDAVVLSSKVQGTIMIAESAKVTREAFSETKRLIERARGRILGVVVNKLRLAPSDYYYYYYYYDYAKPRKARL